MKRFILVAAVFGFANSEAMLTNCVKDFSSNVGKMTLQAFGRNFVQAATQNQVLPKNTETSPTNEAKVPPQQNNGDQNVKKLFKELNENNQDIIELLEEVLQPNSNQDVQKLLNALKKNSQCTKALIKKLPELNKNSQDMPQQNNGDQNVKKLVVEVTLDPKYNPLLRRFWLMAEAMTARRLHEDKSNYYPSTEAWPFWNEHRSIKTKHPYLRDVVEIFEESHKKKYP